MNHIFNNIHYLFVFLCQSLINFMNTQILCHLSFINFVMILIHFYELNLKILIVILNILFIILYIFHEDSKIIDPIIVKSNYFNVFQLTFVNSFKLLNYIL